MRLTMVVTLGTAVCVQTVSKTVGFWFVPKDPIPSEHRPMIYYIA